MKLLSRQDILSVQDIKTEIVKVPEWGGSVKIKGMTASERDKWEASRYDIKGTEVTMRTDNLRAKLVAFSVVDENDKLMFTAGDIEVLGAKSAAAMDRVFAAVQKINAISKEDTDELEKN